MRSSSPEPSTSSSARRRNASWRTGSPAESAAAAARSSSSTRVAPASRSGSGTRSQSSSARSSNDCASANALTRSAAAAARTAAAKAAGWSPGGLPVMGRLRGHVGAAVAERDALLERAGEGSVHLGALARQQVVVHDLAQQRVAEGVLAVGQRDGDLARHRLTKRVEQLARLEPHDRGEQLVIGGGLAGEPAQQLLRGARQPLHAQHQRVAQRRRQSAAAVEPRREDLLREERVPLGAHIEALDEAGIGRRGEDPLELLAELLAREGRQLDQPCARVAAELGEQRPQRVAPVQLVRAVGPDHEHALAAERAREEGEERARRAVGPVQVLDHEQRGCLLVADRVEQRQQALEDTCLCRGLGIHRLAEPRQQRVEAGAQLRRERLEHRVALADERAQGAEQRRVGQFALAELDAVTPEDDHPRPARTENELIREPGLAHARLARDQREGRTALGCVAQGGLEFGELDATARRSARSSCVLPYQHHGATPGRPPGGP